MSNPNSSEQSGKPSKKPKVTPPPLPPKVNEVPLDSSSEESLPEGWRMSPPLPVEKEDKVTYLPLSVEKSSYLLVSLIGYGLIGMYFFDVLNTLFPPRFTDPVWEMRVMDQLVEKTPIPLMGFALVFLRREGYIRKAEMRVMQILSWIALIIGVIYLLMIPLFLLNAKRINDRNETQIDAQVNQQNQQVQQAKQLLQKASDKQIRDIIAASTKNSAPKIDNPKEAKEQLIVQASQAEKNIQEQAIAVRSSKKLDLIKGSIKWTLGALLSGGLLIWCWRITRWTSTFS